MMKESDFVRLHPDLPRNKWGVTIPLGTHGDGASFSHHDSVYTISWNSLIGSGTTVQKRFVATVIKKTDMEEGTMNAIMEVLSWSFNALLSGKAPTEDHAGRPLEGGGGLLAKGWRSSLCQMRGDWAWYCELFKFPQWNSAERMCWLCRASSTIPELGWVRLGGDAGWRRTRWSHESYLRFLRRVGLMIPALLVACIGFRLEGIMVDVLHTVDQGIASHIIANILWICAVVRQVFGGGKQEEQVKNLYSHMQEWYKSIREDTKLAGKLTVERLRTNAQWPKLKAKAAATRHLAAYALHVVQEYGGASKSDRQMLALCRLLNRFYEIIAAESQFLSPAAREELPSLGQKLVGIYMALATEAHRKGEKFWKAMPKLHIFQHLCEWQALERGNPRYFWCYADEDLAGLMAEVAQSCHPRTMASSALFKWLHISFDEDE